VEEVVHLVLRAQIAKRVALELQVVHHLLDHMHQQLVDLYQLEVHHQAQM
jgi:hypothetical protein